MKTNIHLRGIEVSNNEKILLIAPEDFSDLDAEIVVESLRQRFPECDWALLTGGFQTVVLENE